MKTLNNAVARKWGNDRNPKRAFAVLNSIGLGARRFRMEMKFISRNGKILFQWDRK